jgi:F0F1-type ATP synthase membrane subunit c/vacuolar-type H+-ATPase subunit K
MQAGVPSDLNSIARYLGLGGAGSLTGSAPVTGGVGGAATTATAQQPNIPNLQQLSDMLNT